MGGALDDSGPSGPPVTGHRRLGLVILVLTINGSCNVGLNFYNSWALKDREDGPSLTFPIFYTFFHPLVGAFGTLLIICCTPPETGFPSFRQLWAYKLALVPIAICSSLSIGLNNVSLTLVSLFLNQIIKATGPFPTMLMAFLILGTTYTALTIAAVAVLVSGTCLAIPSKDDGTETSLAGVVLCIISTCAQALKPVILKVAFTGTGELPKLPPTVVLFYDSCLSACFMLVYWLASNERDDSIAYFGEHTATAIGVIAGGATMAFCFNFASYFIIYLTSPLTANVFGNTLKVIVILISAFTTTKISEARNWVGISLVCVSLAGYVYAGERAKTYPPKPLTLPFIARKGGTATGLKESSPLQPGQQGGSQLVLLDLVIARCCTGAGGALCVSS